MRRASWPTTARGFTLVEALVCTSIAAMAGAALLLGMSSAMQSTQEAIDQTVAAGLAQQLMDEIAAKRYCDALANPYETTLGPSSWEQAGRGRERFNDLGDFHGFVSQPPTDAWGMPLGADDGQGDRRHAAFRAEDFLRGWRQEVEVYYVDPNDLSQRLLAGQVSNYRAVEVSIWRETPQGGSRRLAVLRRVFAYVPN
jgi:type II secretory pathway pseudopilin PulG